jgi:S1-C subfamily serine protease
MTPMKRVRGPVPGLIFSRTALRLITAAAVFAVAATFAGASGKKEAPTGAAPNSAAGALVAARGVLIAGVQAGSPAEKAGIVRGDIILEADGKAVETPPALQAAINAKKAGDSIALKVQHGDAVKAVTATLGNEAGRAWLGIVTDGRNVPGLGRGFGGMMGNGRGFGLDDGQGDGRFGMMQAGPGAFVASVVTGGPAEKAGIVQGDVILSVDGAAVDAKKPLGDIIAAKKVGDTVTLSVQSVGQPKPHDVKVTLDKNADKDTPRLGIQYSMIGRRAGTLAPGFGRGGAVAAGVFVAEVSAGSPADKAGIKVRDIIARVDGAAVTDPQQVVDAVGKHKPGDSIPVTVTRTDGTSVDLTVVLAASPADASKAYLGVSMGANGFRRQVQPAPRGGVSAAPDTGAADDGVPDIGGPGDSVSSAAPGDSMMGTDTPTL